MTAPSKVVLHSAAYLTMVAAHVPQGTGCKPLSGDSAVSPLSSGPR